jgi:hypothetical protein
MAPMPPIISWSIRYSFTELIPRRFFVALRKVTTKVVQGRAQRRGAASSVGALSKSPIVVAGVVGLNLPSD